MLPPADYKALAPSLLDPLAAAYEADAKGVALLGDVENLVWKLEGREPFILRLTHPSHRDRQALAAELAWLEQLHAAGLSVCLPRRSLAGELVQPVEFLDQTFYSCAFDWIEGVPLKRRVEWDASIIESLGELVAGLHNQAHALAPEQLSVRPDWRAGDHLAHPERLLGADEAWLLNALSDCRRELEALPQGPEHYGLIHGDIHSGNFLIRQGQPVLFDFDDAHRGWYVQDLLVILYYVVPVQPAEQAEFVAGFLTALQRGYARHRPWPAELDEWQNLFLRWRDVQLYLFIRCRWPEQRSERVQQSLNEIGARIRQGKTLLL